jgi:hypothetical protein
MNSNAPHFLLQEIFGRYSNYLEYIICELELKSPTDNKISLFKARIEDDCNQAYSQCFRQLRDEALENISGDRDELIRIGIRNLDELLCKLESYKGLFNVELVAKVFEKHDIPTTDNNYELVTQAQTISIQIICDCIVPDFTDFLEFARFESKVDIQSIYLHTRSNAMKPVIGEEIKRGQKETQSKILSPNSRSFSNSFFAEENEREKLAEIFERLSDGGFVVPRTQAIYKRIFSGRDVEEKIVWRGSYSQLRYLISKIRGKINYSGSVYNVATMCFLKEEREDRSEISAKQLMGAKLSAPDLTQTMRTQIDSYLERPKKVF